jgi:hypothetical protein
VPQLQSLEYQEVMAIEGIKKGNNYRETPMVMGDLPNRIG